MVEWVLLYESTAWTLTNGGGGGGGGLGRGWGGSTKVDVVVVVVVVVVLGGIDHRPIISQTKNREKKVRITKEQTEHSSKQT